MIATLNSDCSTLTLNSDALLEVSGKTFTSLLLKSRSNCSSTETSLNISSLIPEIENNEVSIPATAFYSDASKTNYCDGIYYFELEITYLIEETGQAFQVNDGACKLVDCDLKCKVLEYYIETKDKKAYYQYYALQQGNDCDSCYCTEMCSLYTELKTLLNDNDISIGSNGCGCS